MQKIMQVFAVYLEKDTQLHKSDLLRRVKSDTGKEKRQNHLVQFLTALCFHHIYKDKDGNVYLV